MSSLWRWVPDLGMALCVPPKCGSRSVLLGLVNMLYPGLYTYQSATPSKFRSHSKLGYRDLEWLVENHPDAPRIGFARDPLERFESLARHQADIEKPGLPHEVRGRSVDALIAAISASPNLNAHWCLQSHFLQGATAMLPFEDLPDWWESSFGQELPHVNSSTLAVELKDVQAAFVRGFYAQDYRLYYAALTRIQAL